MRKHDGSISAVARASRSVFEGVPALISKWFALLLLCASSSALAQTPGAASLNEPFYPWMGNGGYDVQDYDVALSFGENLSTVRGSVTIAAVATQDLSVFNLDFGGPTVTGVNVGGLEARVLHEDPELTITPANPIRRGQTFRVRVEYSGRPGSRVSAPGINATSWNWWLGSQLVVLAEPNRLLDWMPANDHPSDKATFTLRLTAPKALTAAAGGTLTAQTDNGDATRTSVFRISTPTTTYGVFFALSDHVLETNEPVGKVQIRHYLSPKTSGLMRQAAGQSGDMIRFFEPRIGAYPFTEFGVLTHAVEAAYGLETQTLVAIPANWGGANATLEDTLEVVAHELAHQWFGMQVTLRDYRDIWIHEGFATYLGWLYTAQASNSFSLEEQIRISYPAGVNGRWTRSYTKTEFLEYLRLYYSNYILLGRDVQPAITLLFGTSMPAPIRETILNAGKTGLPITEFAALLEKLQFTRLNLRYNDLVAFSVLAGASWTPLKDDRFIAPGRVNSGDLIFNRGVYRRGATAVYALREQIGEAAFWALLREFLAKYKFGNASLQDFIDLTRTRVGVDAATLLQKWLFDERIPDLPSLGLYAKDYIWGADFK